MKLFWSPASPFTRKVCIVAREIGYWDKIEVIPTSWSLDLGYKTVKFTNGLTHANPVARIPTLISEYGDSFGDSTIACLYLNDISASKKLIPDGTSKWRMWSLYAIADGMLEAQILMWAEMLRPPEIRSSSFLYKQEERITRCLDAMEKRVSELEASLNLAQITVAIALSYQDWSDWLKDFRAGRPGLSYWYSYFSKRDSMI